jgi:photosystem II stability/assembly factor-like uncharacterized protein
MADMGTDFNGLPDAGTLDGNDVVAVQRGTGADSTLRTTIADILAMSGPTPQTGDMLITARDPGAGWLLHDTVYSQSAYPALFTTLGLIPDDSPGLNWAAYAGTTPTARPYDAVMVGRTSVAVAVCDEAIWRSTDAGMSWTEIKTPGSFLRKVLWVADGILLAFTNGNGSHLRSIDGGLTWTSVVGIPSSYDIPAAAVLSASSIIAANGIGTLHRSRDGGATFTSMQSQGWNSFIPTSLVAVGGATLVATDTTRSVRRSTDGGANWATVTLVSAPGAGATITVFDETTAIITANTGTCTRTTDAGETWSANATIPGGFGSMAGIVRADSHTAVFITQSTPYACGVTFDKGQTWMRTGTAAVGVGTLMATPRNGVIALLSGSKKFRSPHRYLYDPATQFRVPPMPGTDDTYKGYIKE